MEYALYATGTSGEVYSCDKLIVDYKSRHSESADMLRLLASDWRFEVDSWYSCKIGTYRNNLRVRCANGSSFWLGIGRNTGGKPDGKAIRCEFNPNKCGSAPEFRHIRQALATMTQGRPRLRRWDCAIDWPIPRTSCMLVRDKNRLYEEIRHSDNDRTQYLGQRNASGRIKLYNKQLEMQLPEPLTRLEVTLALEDSTAERMRELWPTVYTTHVGGAAAALNDTDAFILRTLLVDPERIGEISRRKRERLEPLLASCCAPLSFCPGAFNDVLRQISAYVFGALEADPIECTLALGLESPFDHRDICPPLGAQTEAAEQLHMEDI